MKIAVLGLLLNSCAIFPRDTDWYIGDLTPLQKQIAREAAADWNNRTDGNHDVVLWEKTGQTQCIVVAEDPSKYKGYEIDGLWDSSPCRIYFRPDLSIDRQRSTLKHEFAHALGMKHTNDPHSLMYGQNDGDATGVITDTDMEECRRVDACD